MVKLSEINTFAGAVAGHVIAVILTSMCFYFLSQQMYTTESFSILSFIMGVYIPSPSEVGRLVKKAAKQQIELRVREAPPDP